MTPTSEQLKLFGKRLARLRKQKGYSQEEFAEATGKMINTISNIERGLTDPKFTTLSALATTLQVNIADLFYDVPGTKQNISSDTVKIIALIENMSPRTKQIALKQLIALSELKD